MAKAFLILVFLKEHAISKPHFREFEICKFGISNLNLTNSLLDLGNRFFILLNSKHSLSIDSPHLMLGAASPTGRLFNRIIKFFV